MAGFHFTILGGGAAGLGAAHFARRAGLPFTLFEAAPHLGGNARTLSVELPAGRFLYDTGAHRLHGADPAMVAEIRGLLGDELCRVSAPSRVYYRGRFLDFPFRAGNLMRVLGPVFCLRAGVGLGWARLRSPRDSQDFEAMARRTYGPDVAQPFLIDYTEKLYGHPCAGLSPALAGRRLRGLHLGSFIREMLFGPGNRAGTLEGAFYYPLEGIGRIAEALHRSAGANNIRAATPVTRIRHDGKRITAVETGGGIHQVDAVDGGTVLSTIPLGLLLELLDPSPPALILELGRTLRFRDVILVAVFLDRERVTDNATVYFPGAEFPFTRVSEPRNRSPRMTPPGKTSLLAEIPVESPILAPGMPSGTLAPGAGGDESWIRPTLDALVSIGWARESEILGTSVRRMRRAYPVLEVDLVPRLSEAARWLSGLKNLRTAGRVGTFAYTHLHDQMRAAHDLVKEISGGQIESSSPMESPDPYLPSVGPSGGESSSGDSSCGDPVAGGSTACAETAGGGSPAARGGEPCA